MRRWLFLWPLLALSVGYAQEPIVKKEEQLREFQRKLDEEKKRLQGVLKKEGSLLHEVQSYSKKIDSLNDETAKLGNERKSVEARIDEAAAKIEELEKRLQMSRADIAKRMRDLYKWGSPNLVQILLTSQTAADLRQRKWFVGRWIDHDRQRMNEFAETVRQLTNRRRKLEEDRQILRSLISDLGSRKEDLEVERESRSTVLAMVQNERNYYRQSVDELEEAAKGLQRLIESLRQGETEGESLFAQMKGKLSLPVVGRLERKFGPYVDPKIQAKLYHKGIDLRVEKGSPIRAVFDGKVAFSDWFVGYGKILIVDHQGGYFTLYAHVDKVLKPVGASVSAGEAIATVGDSGSLKGAYLYFELRHKGISEDPWPWFAH